MVYRDVKPWIIVKEFIGGEDGAKTLSIFRRTIWAISRRRFTSA
ncbi:MAG: hypothetical protein ACREEI_11380 [Stellaceae bacterium]